jgi:hypothetical protein
MSDDYFKLPLRLFGLKAIPAVPVDLEGMVDTLIKLDVRGKQKEQATQGLTREFTIDGLTARAFNFLYGGQPIDEPAATARERLRKSLSGNPIKILGALADRLKDEGEELFEKLHGGSGDSGADGVDLTTLSLDDPKQWSMGWTLLPEVYGNAKNDLDFWASTVDVTQPDRATEEFWPTIAKYGIALNAILPRKITTDEDLEALRQIFGDFWNDDLNQAFTEGRLYCIDLRLFEALEHHKIKGFTRFTPSTLTVLTHQQTATAKTLMPELVRVAGHQGAGAKIFARGQATPAAWLYALQAAKTSVTVWGIWIGHAGHWHIPTAAMQMTMVCHLPEDSRVRRLLDPQSNYVIPFDDVLVVLFAQTAPPTSLCNGIQLLELLNLHFEDRTFFEDDLDVTLESLGLEAKDFTVKEPWDQYPVVQRLLKAWEASAAYVDVFVDNQYPTDQSVQDDKNLQTWIEKSGAKRGGNVRGLPEMDSQDALKRVLRSLIYRITAHGAARLNSTANPAMSFVANFPPCLQDATIPKPTDNFDNKALYAYMPKTGTIAGMINFLFTFAFSPPYEPLVPLTGIDSNLYLEDPACNQALIGYRQSIIDAVEAIQPETPQIYQWPLNIET